MNFFLHFIATLDGSLGYILPVPEKTYRRLLMLQNVLVTHICHIAGLNPKSYRHVSIAIIKIIYLSLFNFLI